MSYSPSCIALTTLGVKPGEILIKLFDDPKEVLIPAHNSPIACIAMNNDSSFVVTASDKGTLIRVWSCATGEKLYELRRGIDVATIICLHFNLSSSYLLCSSDKGTIHVFAIQMPIDDTNKDTSTSKAINDKQPSESSSPTPSISPIAGPTAIPLHPKQPIKASSVNKPSYLKSIVPSFLLPKMQYLDSQWSFAQIRDVGRCICAFNATSTKILVYGRIAIL